MELNDKVMATLDLYLERTMKNLGLLLKLQKSKKSELLHGKAISVFEPPKKYPKRNVPKVCYKEEDVSSDDDYIYCEECNQQYEKSCPQHGPFVHMLDKKVLKGYDPRYAWNTCPEYMSVCRSGIRGAGLGIWTEKILRKGLVFGPYKGKIVRTRPEARESGYAWEIRRGGRVLHYIEGSDTAVSNWMRFVNCAMTEERQNLMAFQYHGHIFYRTYKVVKAYTELLVWYGDDFAADLGIYRTEKKMIQNGELEKRSRNGATSSSGQWTKMESKEPNRDQIICRSNSRKERPTEYRIYDDIPRGGVAASSNGASEVDFAVIKSITPRHGGKRAHKENEKGITRRFKKCPHCDYQTTDSSNLSRHVNAVHYGKRPHPCPHCDYSSTTAQNLQNHVNAVHYGMRPHPCPHCDFSATQAVNLQNHVNEVHYGKRSHPCPHCDYSATQAGNLQNHIDAVHDVKRPHKCPQCDFRASQADSLRIHINAMHERTTSYECHECDYKTYRPGDLRKHTKRMHSEKKDVPTAEV